MTDISQLPRWQRLDEVQRKKAQHHLVNAAGLTGLTASGMGGARWMARNTPAGGMRSAPVARAAKIARGSKFGRALGATTAAAGVLGAGSTLTWGASLGREIKRDEAKLRAQNLVKADSWRNHVSPAAQQGHAYLKRGERDKRALSAIPAAGALAGGGLMASGGVMANRMRSRGRLAGGASLLAGSAALAPSAYRQWKEADRWRGRAGKIEARGRQRMTVGKSLVEVSKLSPTQALSRKRGVSKAVPGLRFKPLIRRGSPVRRGTFVRTLAGSTTYRRGSL